MKTTRPKSHTTIGWWEWVSFPSAHISKIKAKIDTGARTSALHAEELDFYSHKGKEKVSFSVFPVQRSRANHKRLTMNVEEYRVVTSSTGHRTRRPVILMPIVLGPLTYDIELTLVNRDIMGFRMLLGRQALKKNILINPAKKNLLQIKKVKK
jgi:hypothetical protein